MKTCRRKWLARWLAACIAVVLGMGMCAGLPVSAAYENTYTNTGNQRADIVAVAKTQIGYHEGSLEGTTNSSNNYTKYNVWNGKIEGGYRYAWCHAFVSWCANQAGIGTDIVPKTAGTSTGRSFFVNQGTYRQSAANGGSYVPQAGDIIYYGSGSSPSHVGIVSDCDGSTVYTIEGNYSNKVGTRAINLSNSYIIGYGVPNYKGVNPNPPTTATLSKNQVWYDIKDTITLTVSSGNATNYFLSITKDGNSVVQGIEIPGTYSISAADLGYGDYYAWASAANSSGGVDSNGITFSVVGAAAYSSVETAKSIYSLTDTVSISVGTICAKGQVIGIDKNDTTRVVTEACDSTYQISASQLGVGKYSAYFSVYNGSGGVDTERVTFYIYNPENLGTDFYAYIINTEAWKMLTNESDNNVVMHNETGYAEQIWKFTKNSDNSYKIINCKTGKVLDSGGANGNLYTYDDCNNDYQSWYICGESGAYYLKPKNSDMVIDITGGYTDDGTNAQMYNWNGTTAQKFQIWKLDYTPVLPGDLNSDNTLTTADAVLLQRYLLQERTLTQSQWQTADLNADGTVNGFDLALLRQKLVG